MSSASEHGRTFGESHRPMPGEDEETVTDPEGTEGTVSSSSKSSSDMMSEVGRVRLSSVLYLTSDV